MRVVDDYIRYAATCIVLLSVSMIPAILSAQPNVRWQGSLSYSNGSYYFSEPTGSFYITNGIAAELKSVNLSLTLPFVVQGTPWISYAAAANLPTGGTQSGEVRGMGGGSGSGGMGAGGRRNMITIPDTTSYNQASFSDPSLRLSAAVVNSYSSRTSVYLNAGLKFPLSDPASGFGTGAWDVSAGLSLSKGLGRTVIVYTDLMYWWLGDMEELPLKNGLSYGFGIGKLFRDYGWTGNLSISGFTEVIEGYDPPLTLMAGAGYRLNERSSLTFSAGTGLSESSPDLTIGFGWSVGLGK
ncbi:MAG: hypothetical protein R3283_06610 [Balneolaceae bacterium]|nr:hypothetical protein [Balneolaceae bacterium]